MTTYETKLGTVKITSGRTLVKGQWGVMGRLAGREVFLVFAGRPELEAAFPVPATEEVESSKLPDGYVIKNGKMFRVDEMDKETCIK